MKKRQAYGIAALSLICILIASGIIWADVSLWRPSTSSEADILESEGLPMLTSRLTYFLGWDVGTALPIEGGWQVTNDLGYTVAVTDGYLVTRRLELIACEQEAWVPDLLSVLSPQPAFAGHGDGEADESQFDGAIRESLSQFPAAEVQLDPLDVPAGAYCQAHYLVAKPTTVVDDDSPALTLFIEGTYIEPGDLTPQPFEIKTDLAWGTILDLQAEDNNGDRQAMFVITGNGDQAVAFERQLDSLFDGLDWASYSAEQVERTILRNLTEQTAVLVVDPPAERDE